MFHPPVTKISVRARSLTLDDNVTIFSSSFDPETEVFVCEYERPESETITYLGSSQAVSRQSRNLHHNSGSKTGGSKTDVSSIVSIGSAKSCATFRPFVGLDPGFECQEAA